MNRAFSAVVGFGVALLGSGTATAGGQLFDSVAGGFDMQGCGGGGCWTNYIRVADVTGDGAPDVIAPNMGDFFELPGIAQDLEVHTNTGSGTFMNVSATAVGGHEARVRQVAIGDVDGDGDLDVYAPDGAGNDLDAFFINDGLGVFTDELDTRLPGQMSNSSATRFADLDGDGDLDLVIADGYALSGNPETLQIFVNDGLGVFTQDAEAAAGTVSGVDINDIDIADFDRDFDLDILVNPHEGPLALWQNDGTGAFTESPFPGLGGGSGFHYNPAVCDVDGDGDLDVWVDNTGGNYGEQLLINDGSAAFTDETSQVENPAGFSDDNGVACADIDNDGDFDAVVINVGGAGGGGSNLRLLDNDGSGNFTAAPGVFPQLGCALWAEFGELDGDGRLDVVTGAGECGSQNRVYHANEGVPVDDRAPVIIQSEEVAGPVELEAAPLLRFAVSDRFVTDSGAQLDRAYAVLFPAGASEEVDATFMGGDLYRVVLPAQSIDVTVTYRLCAADPQGNVGCTEDLTYDVGMGGEPPGATTGGEDTTGGGVDDTVGGVDDTAGPSSMTGVSATDSAGMASASDTDGTESGANDDDGGGCACTASSTAPGGLVALVLLLVPAGHRRRHERG